MSALVSPPAIFIYLIGAVAGISAGGGRNATGASLPGWVRAAALIGAGYVAWWVLSKGTFRL